MYSYTLDISATFYRLADRELYIGGLGLARGYLNGQS